MKTVEKVWPVITIVLMLIKIILCVLDKNIDAVFGWTAGFLGYTMFLLNEAERRDLIKELNDVYKELRNAEK